MVGRPFAFPPQCCVGGLAVSPAQRWVVSYRDPSPLFLLKRTRCRRRNLNCQTSIMRRSPIRDPLTRKCISCAGHIFPRRSSLFTRSRLCSSRERSSTFLTKTADGTSMASRVLRRSLLDIVTQQSSQQFRNRSATCMMLSLCSKPDNLCTA